MLRYLSSAIRLLLVVSLLGLTVVATGAALGPQIGDIAQTVNGKAYGDITLSSLDTRSEMFDREGALIHRFSTDGSNRELLTLDDLPPELVKSVLTIEDADFLTHPGLNLRATFRALVENVGAGGISQGGSTITQQLVKNLVLNNPEQTVDRKVREAVISWRLEQELTKAEILESYLNTVYFGAGAYGVQAAAEVYFDKDATELGWPESAMLAALISNPSQYDPLVFPDQARRQRQIVFNRLVEVGEIDQEEARFFSRVALPSQRSTPAESVPTDYYVAEVQRRFENGTLPLNPTPELTAIIGETPEERSDALFRGGLRIYTAYDRGAQAEAERARDEVLPENDQGFTMALAAVQPDNGAVRALVGGPEFDNEDDAFNLATQGDRQPGSSFKTFVLVAALEADFVPNDTISGIGPCIFDNPGSVEPTYEVTNFGLSTGSVDTLTRQVTRSSNCAFVRLGQVVGIPNVIETAQRLGVNLDPVLDNNLSLPLGATEVRPLEVASAYATIANGGVRHEPYYIERIEDSEGNLLYEHRAAGQRVLGAEVACLATQVLEQNVIAGTGTRAQIEDQPAGGKTGTTEKFSDAWFVGFSPYLATSVWMGHPEARIEMRNVGGINVTGGSYPAQAWGEFMNEYHNSLERVDFDECAPTRAGRYIRDDGSLTNGTNPCASYPGYSPTDTDGDGRSDQCLANPGAAGYGRCGALDTGDDGNLVYLYCRGGNSSGGSSNSGSVLQQTITCPPGFSPYDGNSDGFPDQCRAGAQQQQQQQQQQQAQGQSVCDPGYRPIDTNGDGRPDVCQYASAPPTPAPPPPPQGSSSQCPAGYPYATDTNGDGRIDTCYASPP